MGRWWIYQRERFPLSAHAPLVAAFTFSAVAFSGFLRGEFVLPSLTSFAAAFVISLLFFLELRIADEFKDFDDDSEFRPYRPVPRGLVKLSELGWVGMGAALVQMAIAVALSPRLLVLLIVTWAYLGLMTKEFFVSRWLKAHPISYLLSHMVIMPLINLCATACDWLPATGVVPAGIGWFLVMSYFNGIVVEVGRKLRAPEDEETGVETYTSLYGPAPRGGSVALGDDAGGSRHGGGRRTGGRGGPGRGGPRLGAGRCARCLAYGSPFGRSSRAPDSSSP